MDYLPSFSFSSLAEKTYKVNIMSGMDIQSVPRYENMPMQYTQIFKAAKLKPEDQRSCKRSPEICYINQIFI